MKNLNHFVAIYHQQLQQGDILIAYNELVKFVMQLRVNFKKQLAGQYSFTGILHGYLDYTYFYFTNEELKNRKLKLGMVLNHVEMRFELWLLGNTKEVQRVYWEQMKASKWNRGRSEMPEYAILEAVLEAEPDFDDLLALAERLEVKAREEAAAMIEAVKA